MRAQKFCSNTERYIYFVKFILGFEIRDIYIFVVVRQESDKQ